VAGARSNGTGSDVSTSDAATDGSGPVAPSTSGR